MWFGGNFPFFFFFFFFKYSVAFLWGITMTAGTLDTYSKSPTYEQVPIWDRVHKCNKDDPGTQLTQFAV